MSEAEDASCPPKYRGISAGVRVWREWNWKSLISVSRGTPARCMRSLILQEALLDPLSSCLLLLQPPQTSLSVPERSPWGMLLHHSGYYPSLDVKHLRPADSGKPPPLLSCPHEFFKQPIALLHGCLWSLGWADEVFTHSPHSSAHRSLCITCPLCNCYDPLGFGDDITTRITEPRAARRPLSKFTTERRNFTSKNHNLANVAILQKKQFHKVRVLSNLAT